MTDPTEPDDEELIQTLKAEEEVEEKSFQAQLEALKQRVSECERWIESRESYECEQNERNL